MTHTCASEAWDVQTTEGTEDSDAGENNDVEIYSPLFDVMYEKVVDCEPEPPYSHSLWERVIGGQHPLVYVDFLDPSLF